MKLTRRIAALLAIVALQATATPQRPNEILIDGVVHYLYSEPLAGSNVTHDRLQGPFSQYQCSSNWSGYTTTWSIQNQQLFLVRVNVGLCGGPGAEIPLNSLFPGRPNPVPATWYSGELSVLMPDAVASGAHREHVPSDFMVFTVSNGLIVKR